MEALALRAPFDPDTHYPLYEAGAASLIENNLCAVASLLVYFKVFKYIGDMPLVRRIFAALAAEPLLVHPDVPVGQLVDELDQPRHDRVQPIRLHLGAPASKAPKRVPEEGRGCSGRTLLPRRA